MSLVSGDVKTALLAFCGLVAICSLSLGDVVINEVELGPSDNGTVWVELYNTGDGAVDLAGWMIKIEDEPWAGPIALSGTIDPKGFNVAEGQSSWVTSGNGTVYLIDISGTVVDKTPELSDLEHNDFTYGRFPDGRNTNTRADFFFMRASKGRSNSV
ncbi:MAG: hypothetical protein A4E44_01575 [Methanosaeta sp. PtaB.Bin018]|nr:MAG: hypothetical protein A4E44_01575 [Methanosaeta sp. PtaB.Bin018]